MKSADPAFIVLFVLLSSLLIFPNLNNSYLWEDEAFTATLGRNTLQYGLPKTFDGINLLSDRIDGKDRNSKGIWSYSTWLPFYLVAGSFAIFGESTYTARLPFALAGIISLLLTYILYRKTFSEKKWAVMAALFLVLSVPYLLHIQQSRYYSLVALSSVWMTIAYWGILEKEKGSILSLALAGLVLFHCFHALLLISFCIMLFHSIIFSRSIEVWKRLSIVCLIWILTIVPFIYYFEMFGSGNQIRLDPTYFPVFRIYLLWVNGFIFPVLLMVIGFFWRLIKDSDKFDKIIPMIIPLFFLTLVFAYVANNTFIDMFLWLQFVFMAGYYILIKNRFRRWGEMSSEEKGLSLSLFIGLSYLLIFPLVVPFPVYRYMIVFVPHLVLAGFLSLRYVMKVNWVLIAVICVMVTSNVLSALPLKGMYKIFNPRELKVDPLYTMAQKEPWQKIRFDLYSYFYELTHDYKGPNEGIAKYLNEHAAPGDVVKVSYGEYPLMFYTSKLKIMNRIDKGGNAPDWIIEREGFPLQTSKVYLRSIQNAEYEKIIIPYPDIPWGNRPDPLYHKFRTDDSAPDVVIYHKKKQH